jgi:hypothetical protein
VQCANTGRGLSKQPEQAGSKPLTDDTKRCSNSRCPKPNPQPVTAFSRNRRTRDGLQNECKTCAAKRGAAWRKREPSYLREYHEANREKILERQKQYREDRLDQARAAVRQNYADNRERYLEYQEHYRAELAAIVFNHYGWQCACPGCSSTDLCIDHVNGDGAQHRTELYGHPDPLLHNNVLPVADRQRIPGRIPDAVPSLQQQQADRYALPHARDEEVRHPWPDR